MLVFPPALMLARTFKNTGTIYYYRTLLTLTIKFDIHISIFGQLLHANSRMADLTLNYTTYIMHSVVKYKRQTGSYKLKSST